MDTAILILILGIVVLDVWQRSTRLETPPPAKSNEVEPEKLPSVRDWMAHDQKALLYYVNSGQGQHLIENLRQKLFADHVNACATDTDATIHNASMKGWNACMSQMLYLSTEDSITGGVPDNAPTTESGQREPETEHDRAII